jgi:MFS family permease
METAATLAQNKVMQYSRTLMRFKCRYGHEWSMSPDNFARLNTGTLTCPACGGDALPLSGNSPVKHRVRLASIVMAGVVSAGITTGAILTAFLSGFVSFDKEVSTEELLALFLFGSLPGALIGTLVGGVRAFYFHKGSAVPNVGTRAVLWATTTVAVIVSGFYLVDLIREVSAGNGTGGFILIKIVGAVGLGMSSCPPNVFIALCANIGVEVVMRFFLPVRRTKDIGRKPPVKRR